MHELRYRSGLGGDATGVSTRPALPLRRWPFLLFPNEGSLNRFFTNINSVQRNIVFTKELETNNCLHFLDVLIEKTSTGFYFYLQETHPYRSLLEMVEFRSVAQETKRCQLSTPPRL